MDTQELARLGMQIANVKQRQIWFPRVGNQIWVSTPQNLASGGEVSSRIVFRCFWALL